MRRFRERAQTAVDFLVSYGIALLIIAVAVYVVVRLGILGGTLAPTTCNPSPSFACGSFALSQNGTALFVLTQATGGTMNVTGIACSTGVNATGNLPQYGNTRVQSYDEDSNDYPNAQVQNGLIIYSGTSATLYTNCYNGGGLLTTGIGSTQTGYIWINYTLSNLPSSYHVVERIIQFTAKST